MFESSIEPVIPGQRCCASAFGDEDGGPSEERRCVGARWVGIRPRLRVDHVALRNTCQPKLATTSIRVGASYPPVDLWYVDLDATADALRCFRQWLSDDELAKAERFRPDLVRTRYIAGRAALRYVLADRLGCSPASIRLSYGTNGKPMLEGGGRHVEFNLAHSGGDAVIALASRAAIGVDIELLRPIADVESLARLVFSDVERRELELAPDPVSAFLNGWTRKEAYVKALGLGLTAPLTEITVSLSGRAALFSTGLRDQPVSNWRLLNVPHPRAVVALALGPRLDSAGTT
jgi:4'-phosphopantetheinyl transferase